MNRVDWLDALQGSGIRPGLGRMRTLLRALGKPQHAVPSIIVAGTNGKGSTSATLASILTQSGLRTSHYTSPHLVDLRERWTIDGAKISEAQLDDAIAQLQRASGECGITPTYFEALTLIAFVAFRDARCDVNVLEVGMGGRLDATNVVRPLAAVITPIGMDHTEFLGSTLRKIAREKAGVIHRGAVVLTTNRDAAVLDVLRRRAAQFGNRFIVVDEERETPLAGAFQRSNAALAARTAFELRAHFPQITEESIARGIEKTRWRGRLERMHVRGVEVWIDGGHNAHAARAIAPFIEQTIPRPRTLVFGIMSDKDVADVTRILFPLFDRVIATEPYPPRSMPAEELAALARELHVDGIAEPEPKRAIERALASGAARLVIAGSLYLAGAAIEHLDPAQPL